MGYLVDLTDDEKQLFEEFLASRQSDLIKQLDILKLTLQKLQGHQAPHLINVIPENSYLARENNSPKYVKVPSYKSHTVLNESEIQEHGWKERIDSAMRTYGGVTARQVIDYVKKYYPNIDKDEETIMRSVTARLSTLTSLGRYEKSLGDGKAIYRMKDPTKG